MITHFTFVTRRPRRHRRHRRRCHRRRRNRRRRRHHYHRCCHIRCRNLRHRCMSQCDNGQSVFANKRTNYDMAFFDVRNLSLKNIFVSL